MSAPWLDDEPLSLLAVVEDERGRQWFRWSAGVAHTSAPWAVLGAVHGDTVSNGDYETYRWEELPNVILVSPGVSREGYPAAWPA